MSTAIRDFDSGQDAVAHILEAARRAGATSADALYVWTDEENVTVRKGTLEKIQASQSQGLGIRVFVGQSQSSISTRDLSRTHIDELVGRAVAMARHTASDPFAGLPEELLPPTVDPESLFPPETEIPTRENLFERASRAEEAALAYDSRITNSEGADCARSQARIVFGNTLGFLGGYRKSSYSLSCSVIATEKDAMERDYWYVVGPHWESTKDPRAVGGESRRPDGLPPSRPPDSDGLLPRPLRPRNGPEPDRTFYGRHLGLRPLPERHLPEGPGGNSGDVGQGDSPGGSVHSGRSGEPTLRRRRPPHEAQDDRGPGNPHHLSL